MLMRMVALILIMGSLLLSVQPIAAECAVAHTHIGVNPTWRPADWANPGTGAVDLDPTDDNKLWFFSLPPVHAAATPGWPNWEQSDGSPFLVLTPVTDGGELVTKPGDPNKVLYTCSFMYSKAAGYGDPNGSEHVNGWHSAHGPQGAWNLESVAAATVPAWDIYVQRQRVSDNLQEDDFFMLLPDDTPVLESDGAVCFLEKRWLDDEGAWGIHDHMGFYFWLDEDDEEVFVVVSAHDARGLYQRSADFVLHFAKTVIQPIPGDLDGDGVVGIHDFEIFVAHWGLSGVYRGAEHETLDHDHDHEHQN